MIFVLSKYFFKISKDSKKLFEINYLFILIIFMMFKNSFHIFLPNFSFIRIPRLFILSLRFFETIHIFLIIYHFFRLLVLLWLLLLWILMQVLLLLLLLLHIIQRFGYLGTFIASLIGPSYRVFIEARIIELLYLLRLFAPRIIIQTFSNILWLELLVFIFFF